MPKGGSQVQGLLFDFLGLLLFFDAGGCKELAKYYAEDPTKVSPEEFFTIIDKFLTSLQAAFEEREAAKKDEEKKAKLEEKKAARKVAAASKKKKVFFFERFVWGSQIDGVCLSGKAQGRSVGQHYGGCCLWSRIPRFAKSNQVQQKDRSRRDGCNACRNGNLKKKKKKEKKKRRGEKWEIQDKNFIRLWSRC